MIMLLIITIITIVSPMHEIPIKHSSLHCSLYAIVTYYRYLLKCILYIIFIALFTKSLRLFCNQQSFLPVNHLNSFVFANRCLCKHIQLWLMLSIRPAPNNGSYILILHISYIDHPYISLIIHTYH